MHGSEMRTTAVDDPVAWSSPGGMSRPSRQISCGSRVEPRDRLTDTAITGNKSLHLIISSFDAAQDNACIVEQIQSEAQAVARWRAGSRVVVEDR